MKQKNPSREVDRSITILVVFVIIYFLLSVARADEWSDRNEIEPDKCIANSLLFYNVVKKTGPKKYVIVSRNVPPKYAISAFEPSVELKSDGPFGGKIKIVGTKKMESNGFLKTVYVWKDCK